MKLLLSNQMSNQPDFQFPSFLVLFHRPAQNNTKSRPRMMLINRLTAFFFCLCLGCCFSFAKLGGRSSRSSGSSNRRILSQHQRTRSPALLGPHHAVLTELTENNLINIISSASFKDTIANYVGYAMGVGATALYAPILLKVLRNDGVEGLSIQTWIFNVLGYALSIAYPLKKAFPLSTFAELLGSGVQSVVILGLISLHYQKGGRFLAGISMLSLAFIWFLVTPNLPLQFLNSIQIAAMLLCNYANIPQIIVTFQRKKASWSGITAFLSAAGCAVRIFTTMQLTQDMLVLSGYILGFITNGILLAQVLLYRNNK